MKNLGTLIAFLSVCLAAPRAPAEQDAAAAQRAAKLKAAEQKTAETTYSLRYQFRAGEKHLSKVTHLATTETKVKGTTVKTQSRSVSTKVWDITDVDDEGNITLVYSLDHLDMWQHASGRPEIRYRSDQDEPPPPEYAAAAKSVGTPLTVATISPSGRVLKRESQLKQYHFGAGDIAMPLPEKRVKAGDQWSTADEIMARLPDGRVKRVKTRVTYTLEKVQTGVATIRVKTEVLTPVDDPRVKCQIVQQLTDGTVKFDVDAGRLLSRQVDWDETVIGFSGPDSIMQYLARMTEETLTDEEVKQASDESGETEKAAKKTAAAPSDSSSPDRGESTRKR